MAQEYDKLLNTYQRMFEMVDAIHFNSRNTADVYGKYIDIPKESKVISITHSGVNDHRRIRQYDHSVLRLGFIGSEAPYKGLPMLKRVIAKLNNEGYKGRISLSVYGGRTGKDVSLDNVGYKGRFSAKQMSSVYETMDLLIVPSIWCETFGFTTIEAFQFGVPALVSSKVGAKDLVKRFAPRFIFETEDELFCILFRLVSNREPLKEFNEKIVSSQWQWSMENHAKDIVREIYDIE